MQMSVPAIVNSATTNDPKGGTDDSIICVCATHIRTCMHQSLGQVSRDLSTSRLGWPHLIEDVASLIELLNRSKNANNHPRVIGGSIGIALLATIGDARPALAERPCLQRARALFPLTDGDLPAGALLLGYTRSVSAQANTAIEGIDMPSFNFTTHEGAMGTITTTGPELMNVVRLSKNGRAECTA